MGRIFLAIFFSSIMAGCSNAPSSPTFKPPNDSQAFDAYRGAVKADWLDQPYDLKSLPKPGLYNTSLQVSNNNKLLSNRYAPKVYGALRSLNVGECEWKPMLLNKVPPFAQSRISKLPDAAYRCSMKIHYQINPPHGEKLSVDHAGWFFMEGGKFVFLGKFKDPYFYSG